jgi:hypothetical protein
MSCIYLGLAEYGDGGGGNLTIINQRNDRSDEGSIASIQVVLCCVRGEGYLKFGLSAERREDQYKGHQEDETLEQRLEHLLGYKRKTNLRESGFCC